MPLQSRLAARGTGLCLLSLDAGWTRAVSQLTILAELMHRLSYEANDSSLNRPCTTFDMIGGVGSGGFIAILLVVFGLTVEETLEEFTDLSVNILDKELLEAQTRTTALEEYVKNILSKYKIDGDAYLSTPSHHAKSCKIVVPVSYGDHVGSIVLLRNYTSRNQQALNLTITQALIATLATPPLFASASGLEEAGKSGYIGADWILSNPTQTIIAEAHEAFGGEERVACLLSLGCGHPRIVSSSEYIHPVEWSWILEQMIANAESKAQDLGIQMGQMGFYHRFSVSCGLGPASSKVVKDLGDMIAHTAVYLGDVCIRQNMDMCEESVLLRNGVIPLDHLKYPGGPAVLSLQLPALTKKFIMRKKPWESIERILLGPRDASDIDGPRMLFVTGMGGCGKTQLLLRFMKENTQRFTRQFFIDGSSEDRIRADVVRNVRALGVEHARKQFEDCLLFLSQQLEGRSLLLYDNVEDPSIDLSSLIPQGDSCLVAITSRNGTLGYLQPEVHLQLDVMSLDEATELLLHGLNLLEPISENIQEDIHRLAQTLGCLPLALQQACAYMRQTKCSVEEYLESLSISRGELLGRAMKIQVNMQPISTHAAFETSFIKLPIHSQKLLKLLSYFHFNSFPLELVKIAARYQFSEFDLTSLERNSDFYIGKKLLEDIFLRRKVWKPIDLDDMIVSLQNYSLVTTTLGVDTLLLQVHPLLHEWVHKCTFEDNQHDYQCAAILLLALGARNEYTHATQYLASHVTHMAALWDHLHVNNAIAFGSLLGQNGIHHEALQLQKRVVEELRHSLNADDIDLSNSVWDLALTHSALRQFKEAEKLQEEVLTKRRKVLGEKHPGTISASSNLALFYGKLGRLQDAESLQNTVLEMKKEILGERHPDTINASNNLAATYYKLKRFDEAEKLFKEGANLRKEILGDRHPHTVSALSNLALTYRNLGRLEEAESLQEKVLMLRKKVLGERNPKTIRAQKNLARTHYMLSQSASAGIHQASVLPGILQSNRTQAYRVQNESGPPTGTLSSLATTQFSSISYTANAARSSGTKSTRIHTYNPHYINRSLPALPIPTIPLGLSSIPSAPGSVLIPPTQSVVSDNETNKEEDQTFVSTASSPVILNSTKISNTSYTTGVSRSFQVLSRGKHTRISDIPHTSKITPSVPAAPTVSMKPVPPELSSISDTPDAVLIAPNQPVNSHNEARKVGEHQGARFIWNKVLSAIRRSDRKRRES